MLASKQNIKACVIAVMLAAGANAAAQSVPTVDDNSGAIRDSNAAVQSNTESIKQYIEDIRLFLGANDRSKITGSGLEIDFGSLTSNGKAITEKAMLDNGSLTGSAADKYYGSNRSGVCNDPNIISKGRNAVVSAITGQESNDPETRLYQACNSARNLLALQLKEIFDIIEVLEQRNNQLKTFLNQGYNTSGDVQKKQYQIALMQALIQNDMTRLQAALAAYETKIAFYKQVQAEAQWEILYGRKTGNSAIQQALGGGGSVNPTTILDGLKKFEQGSGGMLSGGAGIAAATTTAVALESGGWFGDLLSSIGRVYDSFKEKLGINQ